MEQKPLISIIMPAYNSEKYIYDSILSIINQTYHNWELIIVDDCSSDLTVDKINNINDDRIRLIKLKTNSGAAVARNTAVKEATGQYLAFLDSDDFWHPIKLEKQLSFMEDNNYLITSTMFANVDEENSIIDITRNHESQDYNSILKNNPGNSTIMYNAEKLGKFYIPNIKKRNDFVMWLRVIKKAKKLYGLPEVLTYYRVREGSLSANKSDLVKYQWKVYRDIEKLSLTKSFYLLVHKVISVKFNLNKIFPT